MSEIDIAQEDQDVPQMAVAALIAAQQRALASGRPVVLIVDGELVRLGPEGKEVLKKLPPRFKPSVRVKRATQ